MEKVRTKTYSVFDGLRACLENRHTFAIYRLPGQFDVSLIFQDNSNLHEITNLNKLLDQKGFLIAPFANTPLNKTYVIRPDIVARNVMRERDYQRIKQLRGMELNGYHHVEQEEVVKEEFLRRINITLEEIHEGAYDKVVLSRIKKVPGSYKAKLADIFSLLCESYPNAFVYLFNIKGHCWVGATPEPLICSRDQELFTVSLAGTRPYSEANMDIANWNKKEMLEQEYVTEYIRGIIEKYKIENYTRNGPFTRKAGRLVHLRTDFSFSYEASAKRLPALINSLHPTSAVCGLPMETSRDFILDLEKHNREYYAGYLGPIGIDDRLQLFVNLRCMKVLDNELTLFAGGGITQESVPEDEWEETEIKTDTLLSIVQQIR
jgi:isochorismate synthase